MSTWEQKPETDSGDTWKSNSYITRRVVVRKATIGWFWLDQWKVREWNDGLRHWSLTRRCAERSARAYARQFTDPTPPPASFVVSLNPEDLR